MPPRKKTADGAAAAPTRASSRIKATTDAKPAKPASKAAAKPNPRRNVPVMRTTTRKTRMTRRRPSQVARRLRRPKRMTKMTRPPRSQRARRVKRPSLTIHHSLPQNQQRPPLATHQVFANDEAVWDAMLNQTDIGDNKNKFYALQLLHPISSTSQCMLFTHWGRVGESGQKQEKGPFSPTQAVAEFKKQFKAKAGVEWEKRVGMVPKKGNSIPSIMDATLESMNYDARKLPLGKLSKNTILSGFSALKKISEVLADPNCDLAKEHGGRNPALQTLSNAYYSIIPHEFGRSRPTTLDTPERLKRELDLVDALGDMEIASKLISSSNALSDADGNPLNPIDVQFNSLNLSKMEPLDKDGKEFKTLQAYAHDTHGATHGHINARRGSSLEEGGFDKVGHGERMLLWHGSRTTNFAGILQQGLRIAPPEAPVNGYMFGKGVYFADSAGYCYPYQSDNVGCLLLCEVAVQPFYERDDADYNASDHCKEAKARATKGRGRTQPTKWKDAGEALEVDELVGCHMPDGGGSDVTTAGYLQYNEYIVYDISQIRVRYLLMVDM
ncbi:PARP-domain-containing protein [Mucidula mucida]|nr:PARP-domain-containing protein [Mucidula mucida]